MKVTTLITSFNKAATLRRAIDSVLAQVCDFDREIIVLDDGSTDRSVDIILDYIRREKLTRAYLMDHRGMMHNYREGFERCRGQYITFCDCDDYWTNPYRLHYQVAYMDAHPECPLCVTKVHTEVNGHFLPPPPESFWSDDNITFDNLLRGNAYIHAQSYMMRRSAFDKWVDFDLMASRFHVWDYPIVLELIRHGRFHRLPIYTAVYVKNTESATNTNGRRKRLRHILGCYKIRLYYILKYGCRPSTGLYMAYRFARDIASIILKRWNR